MSSEPTEAYVWAWLPGATDPVVVGLVRAFGERHYFYYAPSYRAGVPISIYQPELPLQDGWIRPFEGLSIAGCIRDASPDAWGRRVIQRLRQDNGRYDGTEPSEIAYLLESASDRIGALDFQASPTEYFPRGRTATLEELITAAEKLQAGEPLTPEMGSALLHGTSIGGSCPKVAVREGNHHYIAKLSSSDDPYPVVKAEAVSMELARCCELEVPKVEVIRVLGKDVLLVDRFDRTAEGGRRMMVSALTIFGLSEIAGRYGSYWRFAELIRERFTDPGPTQRELFSRITFNICVSNSDDHAKNHSAFWDGTALMLTPAYDICPSPRSGGETLQAMAIGRDGWRYSQLSGCLDRANEYGLSRKEAKEIVDHQLSTIKEQWSEAADIATLSETEREQMWGRQILNPYILYDYPRSVAPIWSPS